MSAWANSLTTFDREVTARRHPRILTIFVAILEEKSETTPSFDLNSGDPHFQRLCLIAGIRRDNYGNNNQI
jgi:hypothetical protein